MNSLPDTSPSPSALERPCSAFWASAPRIVAESLAPVSVPVVTALRPGPWSAPSAVARRLAQGLLPAEDPCPAPSWLLPGQVRSFRRLVAAVRRFNGALLADPVGSGKTYVALAASRELAGARAAVGFAPAALLPQWRATAERLGVRIELMSHEQVSRGRLPDVRPAVVVIDEAHRFRSPTTRRYRHLAPWLVGRMVVLVTATPVVNRLADLLHQLRLGVRDDALLADGVPSLRALLGAGAGSPALGALVVERPESGGRPQRRILRSDPGSDEEAAAVESLERIDRLRLSHDPPVAALVRSVLRHAATSSPAALAQALRRYRGLLLHARDALAAGRPLDRAELRRFTGEAGDQICWWELLAPNHYGGPLELDLSDLDQLGEVLAAVRRMADAPDPKAERLRALLADGVPSLVFTTRRETVLHLRDRLVPERAAWCTGRRAGLGPTTMPRATVLGWFRESGGAQGAGRPAVKHLVVTEVAAEGLDLQRAARVVHYDLPWTPMRLEQREGRAVRLGSVHAEVEVVRFRLPAALERAMRIERALERKRRLPAAVGLGAEGRRLWRWRTELAEALETGERSRGVAVVRGAASGVLAGFSLHASDAVHPDPACALVWLDDETGWTENDAVVAARLTAAAMAAPVSPREEDASRLRGALEALAGPVRARLALLRERRWTETEPGAPARIVAARLQEAVRSAARRRDHDVLQRLERALAFVAGGHTVGEETMLERLAGRDAAAIERAAGDFPAPTPRWGPVEARLEGVLLFVRE